MSWINTVVGIGLMAVAAGSGVAAEAPYRILDLGTLGGTGSVAHAISRSGVVAGWSFDTNGYRQAFVWREGTMQGLGFLAGGTQSVALAVNEAGQVTGHSFIAPADRHAFLWTNGATAMIDLGTLGTGSSVGRGINAAGEMTGWSQAPITNPMPNDPQAFLWRSNQMHRIRPFNNYSSSEGNAINREGRIAGITAAWAPSLTWWAFVWKDANNNASNDTGEMILLGTYGGPYSSALAINDRNQVGGWADTTGGGRRPFLLTPQGTVWKLPAANNVVTNGLMIDPGTLDGPGGTGEVRALNRYGTAVGVSSSSTGDRAVLWRGGAVIDLNTLIPTNSGWLLRAAQGINDHDEVVGFGEKDGQTRAFLLYREGRLTEGQPGLDTYWAVTTNGLAEVITQQLSTVRSVDLGWSSIWTDPPTTLTAAVEYRVPGPDEAWQILHPAREGGRWEIPVTNAIVQAHSSLWFRVVVTGE